MLRHWAAYGQAVGIVCLATVAAWAMFSFLDSANLVMAYLLAIVIVARRHGRGPSVVAALLSVGLFDLLFVPPYYTFAVSDVRYLFTFAVMLAVALAMSGDRKSTRLNSSHLKLSRMPSSA